MATVPSFFSKSLVPPQNVLDALTRVREKSIHEQKVQQMVFEAFGIISPNQLSIQDRAEFDKVMTTAYKLTEEELTELSGELKKRYIKKVPSSVANLRAGMEHSIRKMWKHGDASEVTSYPKSGEHEKKASKWAKKAEATGNKIEKREKFHNKAVDSLDKKVNEEQLDELSKDTLKSYVKKSDDEVNKYETPPDSKERKNLVRGARLALRKIGRRTKDK